MSVIVSWNMLDMFSFLIINTHSVLNTKLFFEPSVLHNHAAVCLALSYHGLHEGPLVQGKQQVQEGNGLGFVLNTLRNLVLISKNLVVLPSTHGEVLLSVALHPVLGHLGHCEEGAGGGEGVAGVFLCMRVGVRNI